VGPEKRRNENEIDSGNPNPDTGGCVSIEKENLSLQVGSALPHVIVLGEVLWDVFEFSRRLGGAPLNFGVHARRLGHPVTLISALGADEPGEQAAEMIGSLDLDTRFLQNTSRFPTGTAQVQIEHGGATHFTIPRPAAYDAVDLSARDLDLLQQDAHGWFYYGTLFASTDQGKNILRQILHALRETTKFYDLNLRPGFDSPELVSELLQSANVVKLNAEELRRVHEFSGLPLNIEAFCREGSARYGWQAVGVTLGDRGCAVLAGGHFVEAAVHPVEVVDTVGAGDAFAAAFMHGLSLNWPAAEIASFANRVGALVAGRHGAIPDWTLEEAVRL